MLPTISKKNTHIRLKIHLMNQSSQQTSIASVGFFCPEFLLPYIFGSYAGGGGVNVQGGPRKTSYKLGAQNNSNCRGEITWVTH